METPESIKQYEPEYQPDAWMQYSVEELEWWVRLLTKRAGMRVPGPKKEKDLLDASNYQRMRDEMVRELNSGMR